MKWLDIVKQYFSIIATNPESHFIVLIMSVVVTWIIFLYMHRNKISTLNERINLKNDQLDYNKNIISEYEKENLVSDKVDRVKEPSSIEETTGIDNKNIPRNNIREAVIKAIEIKEAEVGKAPAMDTINYISHYYQFGTVLAELISMNNAGLITWEGAPNPPEHWTTLTRNKP